MRHRSVSSLVAHVHFVQVPVYQELSFWIANHLVKLVSDPAKVIIPYLHAIHGLRVCQNHVLTILLVHDAMLACVIIYGNRNLLVAIHVNYSLLVIGIEHDRLALRKAGKAGERKEK